MAEQKTIARKVRKGMVINISNSDDLRKTIEEKNGEITEIRLAPGRYELKKTLKLGKELSGVRLVGDGAVLSGGTVLSGAQLRNDGLIEIPVDGRKINRLYVNGSPRRRSTYPAEGFLESDGTPVQQGWANEKCESGELNCESFKVKDGDLPSYVPKGSEFVILQYWGEARLYPKGIRYDTSTVYFTGKSWRALCWSFGWYIENHPEGLTMPGSWYMDYERNVIQYRPLPGEDPEKLIFEVPRLKTLVNVDTEGREGVTFENITFSCTDAEVPASGHSVPQAELSAPDGVRVSHVVSGGFIGCSFENLGGYALHLAAGCQSVTVSSCQFIGCGAGAIRIGEEKSPREIRDETHHVTVRDCYIGKCGEFYLGSAGIWIGQSGDNTVEHNEITGALQWAISVGWTWSVFPVGAACRNRISYNFIHELGTGVLGSHGALYCLGTSPETVVDHNYIRNVYSNKYWGAGEGIILDNGCTGITVRDNIVLNATAGGWGCNFNCFGCVIRNNIFAFGKKFQLTRYGDAPSGEKPAPNGEIFTQNIVIYEDAPLFFEKKWYAYSTYWDYNLYFDRKGEVKLMSHSIKEWQELGLDVHSVFADPEFVAIDEEDFTLKDTSPAYAIGFRPIDMKGIGITK